jgi:hypothetical protein
MDEASAKLSRKTDDAAALVEGELIAVNPMAYMPSGNRVS